MLNGSLLTNLTIPTSAAKSHYIEAGSDHSKVKILAGTSLEVNTSEGTKLFSATSDIEVSLPQKLDAGTPLPGKDYSLFLVPNGSGSLDFKFSLNSTAPEGYSMADVLRIGGLHTMPVSRMSGTSTLIVNSLNLATTFSESDFKTALNLNILP